MRRLLKFLHTLGAAGFMGAIAALGIVLIVAPASIGTDGYLPLIDAAAKIAAWVLGPSMVLTIISGLLAIAANPAFHDAGWVWVKLATGILVFEGGLHVLGPIQDEAERGTAVPAGGADPTGVASLLTAESDTLWLLFAVSAANVALAIWRPRRFKFRV